MALEKANLQNQLNCLICLTLQERRLDPNAAALLPFCAEYAM